MKKILVVLIILLSITTFAAEEAGKISKYTGKVLLYDGVSPRPSNVKEEDTPLFVKNRITTKKAATAIIEFLNGDRVALSESSTLSISGIEEVKAEQGRAIFNIRKRGQASGFKVALKTAVIGVKGTQFLVDWSEGGKYSVFLKEGNIECTPVEGQFKVYKEVIIDEYEAYVKKMSGEYEDYVEKLAEEFVEFVDSFEMKPGQAFNITGQDVRKVDYTPEIDKAFDIFDEMENAINEDSSNTPAEEEKAQSAEPTIEKQEMTPISKKPVTEDSNLSSDDDDDDDDEFNERDELDEEFENF
ncbi:MAG: hypothetical protein C0603_02820 [Denitrovibrio sp.]|nr:MAG: hypothetical protein C0603_02820 [Denitrovibrio sp.]